MIIAVRWVEPYVGISGGILLKFPRLVISIVAEWQSLGAGDCCGTTSES